MDLIRQLKEETGLPTSRFILAGFSQGGMLSTDVALHLDENPAALCSFSGPRGLLLLCLLVSVLMLSQGGLLCEDKWQPLMSQRKGMKVLLSHGAQDPLIPQVSSLQ